MYLSPLTVQIDDSDALLVAGWISDRLQTPTDFSVTEMTENIFRIILP